MDSLWVIIYNQSQYTPFISKWNYPFILTIDRNFQQDIQVGELGKSFEPSNTMQHCIQMSAAIDRPEFWRWSADAVFEGLRDSQRKR